MKNGFFPFLLAGICYTTSIAAADLDTKLHARPESAESQSSLASAGFGESIDLRTGSTSFSYTDVSIPVSDALTVQFGRKLVLTSDYFDFYGPTIDNWTTNPTSSIQWDRMILGQYWDADVPFMRGIYDARTGWVSTSFASSSTPTLKRCSEGFEPPTVQGVEPFYRQPFKSWQYWGGIQINLPGRGERTLVRLADSAPRPQDGRAYVGGTAAKDRVACLSTLKNGEGEGFLLVAPDGSKYYFDWMAVRHRGPLMSGATMTTSPGSQAPEYVAPQTMLPLVDAYLFATRVEDRFGNWVQYRYDVGNPFKLLDITSSAGATLEFTYSATGQLSSVSQGARRWQYFFDSSRVLTSTLLPDGTSWRYSSASDLMTLVNSSESDARKIQKACVVDVGSMRSGASPEVYDAADFVITTPAGARGTFGFREIVHGTNNAPGSCDYLKMGTSRGTPGSEIFWWETYIQGAPLINRVVSLERKEIEGPGVPRSTWRYRYEPSWSYASQCTSGGCANSSKTVVTSPTQVETHYTFGNDFQTNLGLLLQTSTRTGSTTHQSSVSQYVQADTWGKDAGPLSSPVLHRNHPVSQSTTTRDGVNFTISYSQFDTFARPLAISESSSLGYARSSTVTYHDNLPIWVVGQQSRQVVAGIEVSRTEFDSLARPWRTWAFGQVTGRTGYRADGTLAWIADAKGQQTSLNNWYRGIPRSISYPDGTSRSATVSPEGWLTSLTDQNGATTTYQYDLMGRVTNVTHPTGDSVNWTPSSYALTVSGASTYGLPAGHWQRRRTEGNRTRITYLDALFRPVVEETYDAINPGSTRSVVVKQYDAEGRLTYQSHPQRSISGVSTSYPGVTTTYDALGRVAAINDTGRFTAIQYTGGQRRTTNPLGRIITESFLMYGAPSYDWPTWVELPEGVNIDIQRDLFGKPVSMTRGGGGTAYQRQYVYDAQQRLCKSINPETGATLYDYDPNGNAVWSAAGTTLTTTACDRTSVPGTQRTNRNYDAMNRLVSVDYPGSAVDTTYSYTPTGLLARATAGSNVTTYQYNRRGMPTRENYNYPGAGDYPHQWEYDALGNLAAEITINGIRVDYGPNALGQATQAGGYASGARYDAAGRLLGFFYGNGMMRDITYDAWGEPTRIRDSNGPGVDLGYSYDSHGNITGITDNTGGILTRNGFSYDGLDRLLTVNNPGGFGAASYTYDSVDNLKTATLAGNTLTYNYAPGTNRLASITNSAGGTVNSLLYDAYGNIVRNNSREHRFDAANRLTEVVGVARYEYDAHNRRTITWRQDGTGKNDVYTQDGVLRYTSDNALQGGRVHIYLGGLPIAEQFRRWDGTGTTNLRYLHTDALRSVVAGTGASREVLMSARAYQPYGKTSQTLFDRAGFTYHMEDRYTDLVYMQQRYYDPAIGRFLSVDPVGPLSNPISHFGRYHYAANNPYRYVDPDGRYFESAIEIASLGVGIYSLKQNIAAGNTGAAILDGVGIVLDGAALAVPIVPGGVGLGIKAGRGVDAAVSVDRAADAVTNPVSDTLARVVPGDVNPTTLGRPGDVDVFVTNASELQGLSASEIAQKLTIPESSTGFRVIEFPSEGVSGIASPVNRENAGFIGGGRTAGGASEFVIPNGPIPQNATQRVVR